MISCISNAVKGFTKFVNSVEKTVNAVTKPFESASKLIATIAPLVIAENKKTMQRVAIGTAIGLTGTYFAFKYALKS